MEAKLLRREVGRALGTRAWCCSTPPRGGTVPYGPLNISLYSWIPLFNGNFGAPFLHLATANIFMESETVNQREPLKKMKSYCCPFSVPWFGEPPYIYFSLDPPDQPQRLVLLRPSAGEQTEDQQQVGQRLVQSDERME